MKVAFIHYHLKSGGVTTVLKQQLTALPDHWTTLVLTGSGPQTSFPTPWIHIPELAYSSQYLGRIDPDDVAGKILEAIQAKFGGPCDVLHVHNPTLAKNQQFMRILNSLQKRGANLLLQIHDFAEDGRPRFFFTDVYPSDCHYSVINRRDYHILLNAGLNTRGLHLLENAVASPTLSPTPLHRPQPLTLYPVRAIRRKNIGEAILWSLFFNDRAILSISLPPNSDADIQSHKNWKAFVKERHLKVAFDRGLNIDFEANVISADSLLTTSISEGFGFAFIEPWLYGKLLWGRRLADICRDFEDRGIQLHHLYTRLLVPVDWFGFQKFRVKWVRCVQAACDLFDHSMDNLRISQAFDAITRDGHIDFGLLDEGSQIEILSRLIGDRNKRDQLMELNPFLANPGEVQDKHQLIRHNQKAVEQGYNQQKYGRTLRAIYERVANTPVRQTIDKRVLISTFLDLENFSLLKWSDYVE
jgi:hypothetical protein